MSFDNALYTNLLKIRKTTFQSIVHMTYHFKLPLRKVVYCSTLNWSFLHKLFVIFPVTLDKTWKLMLTLCTKLGFPRVPLWILEYSHYERIKYKWIILPKNLSYWILIKLNVNLYMIEPGRTCLTRHKETKINIFILFVFLM